MSTNARSPVWFAPSITTSHLLTTDDRQVLAHAANGLTRPCITDAMRVDAACINRAFKRIHRFFGTGMAQHAVAAAIDAHLITACQTVALPDLTPRQRQCLLMAIDIGASTRIARALGLSPVTAKRHLDDARHRLGAATIAQAVALAIVGGIRSS